MLPGISRQGSGSHLMSFVLAEQKEWNVDSGELKFEILNNIHGLVDGNFVHNQTLSYQE